jgi:hypothetical protein
MADQSKRLFLPRYLRQLMGEVVGAYHEGVKEVNRRADFERFFESEESSASLTLAYPDDILMETARIEGIETTGREKSVIVRELFLKKGDFS